MGLLVNIPQIDIYSKVDGVKAILEKLSPFFQEQEEIILDFRNCHFISAEGIALIAGMKLIRDERGFITSINMDTIDAPVKLILGKSKFLELFGFKEEMYTGNTLPLYSQRRLCKEDVFNYIDSEILNRAEMPEMSNSLRKEIRRAFFEIFGNIFYHSESPIGGLVCGQVYPNSKEIQIVFYDGGIGIGKRVRKFEQSISSDIAAIEWALKRGTSTSSNLGESRGLGLYLLCQFLRVNEGELYIYANKGAIIERGGVRTPSILPSNLIGTLIDMRIKVRNDVKYTFAYEM